MSEFLIAVSVMWIAAVIGLSIRLRGKSKGRERQREPKTSNLILLAMGLFAAAFIVTMIVIFCVKGAVPDTLIQYTLGAGGVEALLLAGIKISKVRAGEKPGEREEPYE